MIRHAAFHCPTCGGETLFAKRATNQLLHIALAIVTVGLWLLVWLPIELMNSGQRYACVVCGTRIGAKRADPQDWYKAQQVKAANVRAMNQQSRADAERIRERMAGGSTPKE